MGSPKFDACARAILEIHTKLSSSLPPESLQEWIPIMDEGSICVEFSNRYFAVSSDCDHLNTIKIPSDVDPLGILAKAVPNGRYTEDNHILYYDQIIQPDE